MKKLSIRAVVIVLAVGVAACESSSTSNDTTTSKVFPSTVGIDISTASSDTIPRAIISKAIPSTGNLASPMTAATNMVQATNVITGDVMGGISTAFNDIVDSTSTQATATALDKTVKIDFSAYDFNGDGATIGSGTAATSASQPVVFRLWADNIRAIAGKLTTLPTFDADGVMQSVGAGTLYMAPSAIMTAEQIAALDMGDNVQIKATYDQTDADNLSFDSTLRGTVFEMITEIADINIMQNTVGAVVSGGVTTYLVKTGGSFTADATIGASPYFSSLQFIASWFSNGDLMILRSDGTYHDATTQDVNLCGSLTTGDMAGGGPADIRMCLDAGFSEATIADDQQLPIATDTTIPDFPADFPTTPTF